MANEPKAMKEVHDIREKIYEETKDLTAEQRVKRTNQAVQEMEEKHSVKFRRSDDTPVHRVI